MPAPAGPAPGARPPAPAGDGRFVRIVDPSDERLVAYRDLTDAELRRRRDAEGAIFVAEGRLAVEQLVRGSFAIQSMLLTDNRLERMKDAIEAAGVAGAPIYLATREVVAATVGFDLHRGVVAIGRRPPPADASRLIAQAAGVGRPPIVAVVEGVNDHENLGALFRNAAAFGLAAVLLDPSSADPLYRRSVRVSLGHVLRVPFARLQPWPAGLDLLRRAGFVIAGLSPDRRTLSPPSPPAIRLDELPVAGPVAVVVGAEGPGLSPGALAGADLLVSIPMADGVDSLNVATAAAIAFHHLAATGP